MKQPVSLRPNPFIYVRIFSVPVLWFFAFMDWQFVLGVGIGLSALTDVLDGRLAAVDSAYSNPRLDSFADKLLTISVLLWLILLKPFLFVDHALWIGIAGLTFVTSILISMFKFGRPTTLHLYSGKYGGLLQAIFTVHVFVSAEYSPILFYIATGSFIIAGIEEILVLLTASEIVEDKMKSILPFLNR
jgi:phosphatidylglycerophosphate synthase